MTTKCVFKNLIKFIVYFVIICITFIIVLLFGMGLDRFIDKNISPKIENIIDKDKDK